MTVAHVSPWPSKCVAGPQVSPDGRTGRHGREATARITRTADPPLSRNREAPIHPCARAGHGFSLVELLVVLSVIAVLAGMLLPTISQVRRSAQIAGCMSNLRQLGMANLAYANENQGTYVPGFGFDAYGAPLYDTTRWSQNKEFLDYLCNDGRDHAADGSLPRGLICPRVRNITDSTAVTTSYGLNQWSLRGGWWPNTYCTTRVGQTSGNVMMFGDGLDWLLRDGVSYRPEFEGTYNLNGIVAFRHGHDSMVAVLYDGSTPLVPKTAFVYATPYWWD